MTSTTETWTTAEPKRRPRADALRNRTAVVNAATHLLNERGVDVPVRDIAERAGVGLATVYRQFPSKEALFEAIILDRLVEMADAAEGATTEPHPGSALRDFFEFCVVHTGPKRMLVDALGGPDGVDASPKLAAEVSRLEQHTATLLDAARRTGSIRADVSLDVFVALITSISLGYERARWSPELLQQTLDVIVAGLRPDHSH